jgi:proteasome lid subunit RPN8/RPN11
MTGISHIEGLNQTLRPTLRITSSALSGMMVELSSRPVESGGILLGPIGKMEVSTFIFDEGGSCTGTTYSPAYRDLQKRLTEVWLPEGLDLKGFAHSHPGRLDRLSQGDLAYIRRFLFNPRNADMEFFVAPIVIPEEFRLVPFVVKRSSPEFQEYAHLNII